MCWYCSTLGSLTDDLAFAINVPPGSVVRPDYFEDVILSDVGPFSPAYDPERRTALEKIVGAPIVPMGSAEERSEATWAYGTAHYRKSFTSFGWTKLNDDQLEDMGLMVDGTLRYHDAKTPQGLRYHDPSIR